MRRLAFSAVLMLCGMSSAFAQKASASPDHVKEGAEVFRRWCAECHGAGARPGTAALQHKYQGAVPAALEQRAELPDTLVRFAVRNGMSFMPFFRKTEVSDQDLDALVAYLASARVLRAQAENQSPK